MTTIQIKINLKKWIRLSPIIIMLICFLYNTLESKPFKFEDFDSEKEANAFLRKRYAGKHIAEVLCEMEKIGVECGRKSLRYKDLSRFKKYIPDYEKYQDVFSGSCECWYSNNMLSRDPMTYYRFYFYLDNNDKVFGVLLRGLGKFVI